VADPPIQIAAADVVATTVGSGFTVTDTVEVFTQPFTVLVPVTV
jgi:hypothetical protein